MAKPFVKQEWQAKIIAHAWKDPQFKKELIAHPKEALKKIGCPTPDHYQVNVIEEKDNGWTIVIPKAPADTRSLSEADLKALAGGSHIVTGPHIVTGT